MKRFLLFPVTLLLCFQLSGQRGTIVSTFPMATLSPEEIMLNLKNNLDGTAYTLAGLFIYQKYSVTAVKVIYKTINGKGQPTTASGVVFLPVVNKTTRLPVLSYLHGTLTRKTDAPSYLTGIESVIGWIMAMDGYISVLPDYIGLGDGPGLHPYHHAATEASASVDMLKAAMQYCNSAPDIKAKPNGSLYLEGYSQGGHAALATQEELQRNPVPGLILQKTVAGSGAYSLSLVQKNFVFDHADYASPSFLPYLLLGYQEVYGNMYGNLNQVFVQPYSTAMPGLFDGSLTVNEINLQLPAQWQSMFNPTYLWNLRYSYLHPVNSALRKNDLINWKPQSDLHLYYCTCDELVDNNNSLLAYLSFILKGSNRVTTAPLGPFKHAECAPFVMLLAKVKFDCDSHANPCGINLLSLLKSDTDDELVQFSQAMEESYQAPAVEDLLQDNILASYLSQEIPQEKNKLHVYPNPANDIVNVQLSSEMAGKAIISLFDMQGRRIREENYTGNLMIIDVKPLPAGIYKVVVSGDINLSQTLVVSK